MPKFLVVPDQPGAALAPPAAAPERDEVDSIVDELFGEDTTDGPGVADVVLFTLGIAVVVWGALAGSNGLVVAGVIVGLLGIVLPLRAAARRLRNRRADQSSPGPLVLDISSPLTARLARGYADVIDVAAPADAAALQAALLAVHEVATLLDGRSAIGAAEAEYVGARADALDSLADTLRVRRRSIANDPAGNAAQIEARNEIDAITGTGALARIDALIEDHRADG